MFVLVLAAEADETRQAITFLIVCLVGIAVMLSLLTVWYWRVTSPKRRARLSTPAGPQFDASRPAVAPSSAVAPAPATVEIDRLPLGPALAVGPGRPRIEIPDRSAGRPSVAARIEVVERCNKRSGAGRGRTRLEPVPAAMGTDSHHRNGSPNGRQPGMVGSDAGSAVLSDDDWASVMRSAFDKMQR